MTIRKASDRSLLVSFGGEISFPNHLQVKQLTEALQGARGVVNLHPAFASLLIDFDPRLQTHEDMEALVCRRLADFGPDPASNLPAGQEAAALAIPVQYGGECGPDLQDVARHTGLSPERVVEIFSAAEYLVYFVGFATCFPYLGGLPPELATPRLAAPRKQVPAGSVGIAGAQAGIYPLASPGGWRLIGRTSLRLFDPEGEPPPLLRMGHRLRFPPI